MVDKIKISSICSRILRKKRDYKQAKDAYLKEAIRDPLQTPVACPSIRGTETDLPHLVRLANQRRTIQFNDNHRSCNKNNQLSEHIGNSLMEVSTSF